MPYFLDLFSPETYEAFLRSSRAVSGFRIRQRRAASRVAPGAKLLCYLTGLSRWIGMLEVIDGPFEDSSPLFTDENDPFVVRFRVRPIILLEPEKAIPIHEPDVWNRLSFTKDHDATSSSWTGKVRSSLVGIDEADGALLEHLLIRQRESPRVFPIDAAVRRRLTPHTVQRADRTVTVTVPDEAEVESVVAVSAVPEVRESAQIQALLAKIGAGMGMRIWIPRSDRGLVVQEWPGAASAMADRLPLNYDDTTLRTIENIDVLWLRGRSIIRAFEVEHTTSIYSGILRMADLLALQPNMDIRLHIVAPGFKRDKVFQEIRRPVFSLLERKPLAEVCSFLAYESLRELAQERHLSHLSDSVLDEYAEEAE
jgi:hypothetical protein